MDRIVLDTNCFIASLSRKGQFYDIWKGLQEGKYILCVSTEIMLEYQEIIEQKTNASIANNIIQVLLNSRFVLVKEPYFRMGLIDKDKDDNKFVDCAVAAQAIFIVSNDKHYDVLKTIPFPKVDVVNIMEFLRYLKSIDQ